MSLDDDLLTACSGFEMATAGLATGSAIHSIMQIPGYVPTVHYTTMAAIMSVPDNCLHTAMAAIGLYAVAVGLRQTAYWLMRERPGQPRLKTEIVKDPMMEYIDE